jgi:dCTP deaminase
MHFPYGILPDSAIRMAVRDGDIEIDPFDERNLNPVSYDLTLGDEVMVYKKWVGYDANYDVWPFGGRPSAEPRDGSNITSYTNDKGNVLDVKEEPEVVKFKIDPEAGWLLRPGIGYLMCTRERVGTKKYVPILDGKSSTARLFMMTHFCAGFGDPGFLGQYTMEVSVMHPLRVYAGMKIAQIRFHTIGGLGRVSKLYDGNYTGEAATGPVASRAFRQFIK